MSSNNHNNKQQKKETYLSKKLTREDWYIECTNINKRVRAFAMPISKGVKIEAYAIKYYNGQISKSAISNNVYNSGNVYLSNKINDYLMMYKKEILQDLFYYESEMPKYPLPTVHGLGEITIADWNNLTNEQKLSYL